MTWKNVKIREEIYDRVATLAGRGSVSSMFEEIVLTYFKQAGEVEEALDESRELGREHHKANAEADGESDAKRRSASSTSSRGRGATGSTLGCSPTDRGSSPRGPKERKQMCEHRIPPGSYCRVCDG